MEDLQRFQQAQFNDIRTLKVQDGRLRDMTESANNKTSEFSNRKTPTFLTLYRLCSDKLLSGLLDLNSNHEGHQLLLNDIHSRLSGVARDKDKLQEQIDNLDNSIEERYVKCFVNHTSALIFARTVQAVSDK